jgi:hypothetical protein
MRNDTDRACDALQSLNPNCDRAAWVKTGMAYHAAGGDFDSFNSWSTPAENYNAQACKATWRSFKTAPGGVSAGALFGMARDNGWQDGDAAQRPAPERATKPVEPPRKPVMGMSAGEVWERCEAVKSHPYATRKQLAPDVLKLLRVVPDNDPLTHYRGWLAIPGYGADGTLQTIEFIDGDGTKRTLKDSTKSGASLCVGPATGPVIVVEGIGHASAAYASTGHRAIACFGSGNIKRVVEALRQREPDVQIVLAPDRGKEADAKTIATAFNCSVACLPESLPNNYDINDLYCSPDGGFDAVQALLEGAVAPPKPEPLLKPVSVFDVVSNPSPPPAFVWDGYLPRGNVALLGAHGGTGKSTIALMLAVCTALGRPLFGIDTEPCKVLFASLEDGAGVVRHRLAHICKTWAIDPEQLRDKLLIVDGTEHPELFIAESRGSGESTSSYFELRQLVQSENVGLVLVDNASDGYGGNEIDRHQVRAFMRTLALVSRLTDASVMLLAHVDKATSRNKKAEGGEGYSGSTAWHNSARSRLFLTRGEDGALTLEHQKSNLGKLREPLTLTWPDCGLPMLSSDAPDVSGFTARMNGRADDERAIALLKLIAEFESRGQYCSPAITSRNHVYAVLRSEPGFQKLKLNSDSTRRIVNQCQRAKWIETLEYKTAHSHKYSQRWTLTTEGRSFSGLPAPTSPTSPTHDVDAQGDHGDMGGSPTSPTYPRGYGGIARTHLDGADTPDNEPAGSENA